MTDAAMSIPGRRVEMRYEGTAPQRRLTVAFRIILAIPQFIVVYFLAIAAVFVLVIGWVAALFMGRLPGWAHDFMAGVLRWTTRLGAYMFLLTDRYPPFSLDDEPYPARPRIPAPGPLNRWAVLFRVILVIPAAVFANIVEYGLTFPLLFVAWLVVLVSGGMPPALYAAYSALLRYHVRFNAYFAMLTSEYAWGMLGDQGAPPPPQSFFATLQEPSSAPGYPPAPPPPQPFSYPSAPTASTGSPGAETPASPPHAAPQWPPPVPPPPPPTGVGAMPPPSEWERAAPAGESPEWGMLVLSSAARGWMIFAIVWGSILFVGQNIAQTALRHHRHTTAQLAPTGVHRVTVPSGAGSPLGFVVTLSPRGTQGPADGGSPDPG